MPLKISRGISPKMYRPLCWFVFVCFGCFIFPSTLLANPDFCETDSACSEKMCIAGRCVESSCQEDKGCAKTQHCVDFQCRDNLCEKSAECGDGVSCVQGRCWGPIVSVSKSDGRQMMLIPGGNFQMGNARSDAVSDEVPTHWVELKPFLMDRFEVSARAYQACLDAGVCVASEVKTSQEWEGCTIGDPNHPDLPANCISWKGADSYCRWVDKRLPSEAEWERAAGGGLGRTYVWGYQSPNCDRTCSNREGPGCGTNTLCPADSKPEDTSVFGVRNMSGSLQEWVADWYGRAYFSKKVRLNPAGSTGKKERRSIRGGSYHDTFDRLRIASRDRLEPHHRSERVGFRCVRGFESLP